MGTIDVIILNIDDFNRYMQLHEPAFEKRESVRKSAPKIDEHGVQPGGNFHELIALSNAPFIEFLNTDEGALSIPGDYYHINDKCVAVRLYGVGFTPRVTSVLRRKGMSVTEMEVDFDDSISVEENILASFRGARR